MATTINENLEISAALGDTAVEQNHENLDSGLPNHGSLDPEPAFSEEEVLAEYPEAKMTNEQQTSSLGETFQELVKRLDDALQSFYEGPPFTLQRLCEILLSARSIYPKLPKLSLALEKNLLVTSTLKMSEDPHPLTTEQNSNGSYEGNGNTLPQNDAVENGVEASVEDRDEVMADVQDNEVGEDTTMEMETIEDDVVKSTEANPAPKVDS